jgi:hypothetical protein
MISAILGLSEPIRFPTNIENGTGILGISMGTSQTIPVRLIHQEYFVDRNYFD